MVKWIEMGLSSDDELFPKKAREVKQSQMTSECWGIQFQGKEACATCEFKGTKDCGGQDILKIGKNSLGYQVPLGKAVKSEELSEIF